MPSASLLLDDPNLLFVNAGMVPFKPYFLGQETPPYPRAVSVQKCVRTPDIEDVGKTTRHGTFFEMCGNFSFGDYFKEGAIELAWDLVTKSPGRRRLRASTESRLYPTVLDGDDEALDLWRRSPGCPTSGSCGSGPRRTTGRWACPGPAGPCSEILDDRGPEFGPDGGPDRRRGPLPGDLEPGLHAGRAAARCGPRRTSTSSARCRSKNIDTGMGLERVAFLLQGVDNMYEIDVMFPVIERAEELTGRRYGADHDDDVRFRVVADHVRSSMMLIGDGVTPGQRGPRLRAAPAAAPGGPLDAAARLRGPRRCPSCCPVSRDKMGETYPELHRDWERISTVAYAEEDAFRQTLRAGTRSSTWRRPR